MTIHCMYIYIYIDYILAHINKVHGLTFCCVGCVRYIIKSAMLATSIS